MSNQLYTIACSESDMPCERCKPYPWFRMDGSCAHRFIDSADRCQMCAIEMDDEAWLDARVAR